MKFAAVTTLMLSVVASAASAADLPSRVAPPVFVPEVPPAFTWTGFYVGANAGYAFDAGRSSRYAGNNAVLQSNVLSGYRPAYGRLESNGFTGGGQIGYNYELGHFGPLGGGIVLGVEADAAYTDIHEQGAYIRAAESDLSARTNFVGTVRGRLGYAFANVLLYGTGGFAYADQTSSASFLGPTGAQFYHGSTSGLVTGYAYGGGVEFALPTQTFLNVFKSSAVTMKAEFIRYQMGDGTLAITNNAGLDPGYTQRYRASGDIVRVGVNYKFGGIAPPVVARY